MRRKPGIGVYDVPALRAKYGRQRVRFADLARREQNALRKWRFEQRVKRGTITPEEHYLRLKRGEFIPEGLERKRLRKHGERWLSFSWYALPKEKELFKARRGTNPQARMTMRQRIYGRQFRKGELKQIYGQKRFVFELLTQHLPLPVKRAFLSKMLSREMLTRTMSTRAFIDYPTIPEVREETWTNITDLRQDRQMFGGYTHTRTGRDYLAPDYWQRGGGLRTSPVHEAVHQLRLYLFGMKLPVNVKRAAPMHMIEDVPWAQALDRFYGIKNSIYKIDKKIGEPTLNDFNRKQRAYANPIDAIDNEPDWSYNVGNKIGQWAFRRFGAEGGANYIFLRVWGKSHEDAFGTINNNKMQATLREMQIRFGKKREAEIVPIGKELRKAA